MLANCPNPDPEALQLFEEPETQIDLILTDIVMPGGMTGFELIRAARRLRPELAAILTSGYTAGSTAAALGEENDSAEKLPLLSKPYQQAKLARVVGQVLAHQPP